ncbi:MAG: hypothetical protein HS111_11315 [Kofleriaceae bacterium]|nr:hypothetical protein [Kofleriaceae bacterium]
MSALRDDQGRRAAQLHGRHGRQHGDAGAGGGTPEEFVYDGEGPVARATRTGSGAGVEEYFYDHAGQRAAVVTRDAVGAVESVRVFFGDAEVVPSPTGWRRRPRAPVAGHAGRAHPPTAASWAPVPRPGRSTLVSAAPTGDIRAASSTARTARCSRSVGPAVEDQHRQFNDKFQDDLTRLSYYGVRYYDNLLLGWTQADPMYRFVPDAAWDEPRRGLLYQYTLANPLAYLDPDGRSPKVLGWVAGGGIGCVAGAIEGSGCKSGAKKGAKVGAKVTSVVGAPVVVVLGGVLGMSSDQATPPAMSDKTLGALAASFVATMAMSTPKSGEDTDTDTTASGETTGTTTTPPGCPPPGPRQRVKGEKGDRMRESDTLETALEQLDGISAAQDRHGSNRSATINSKKKSEQNVDNRLRRIRCEADVDD